MKKLILICLLSIFFIFADCSFAWFVDEYDLEFLEEDKKVIKTVNGMEFVLIPSCNFNKGFLYADDGSNSGSVEGCYGE